MSRHAAELRVGVVGVGTMGSMTLWRLARRGIRAVGFEQFWPGHDRGAAGGDTRMFRTAYFEGPEYLPLLGRSLRLWRELEAETGTALLKLNGGLMIGADALASLPAAGLGADLDVEQLDPPDARARYPQHAFAADDAAVLDRKAGFLRAHLAILAAARRAEDLGATIRNQAVDAIDVSPGEVAVHVAGERIRFDRLIVAAGPWTARLVPQYTSALDVRRVVLTWFAADVPGLFAPERFPVFLRQTRTNSLGGFKYLGGYPSVDGMTVKVSGVAHDPVPDPDRLDRAVDPAALSSLRASIRRYLPGLHPDPVRVSAYMDAYTPDNHAIVGYVPDTRCIVLAGFSGHGFKLSPVIAEAAADLAADGETSLPISHLSVSRLRPAQPSER